MVNPPFETGKAYLFCQVTLYYVGRVKDKGLGWVLLEDASWVHWTGRLSELLKKQSFAKVTSRKPRLERCGEVGIATSALVSWYPWHGELPAESIQ